jgi:hypothetical protein
VNLSRQTSGGSRGNALFLILIAVALFAALAYAVTQSGRSGNGATAKEKASLVAARMVSTANMMSQAINRLMLTGGCADTYLDIGYGNSTSGTPTDGSCNLFAANGGGLASGDFYGFLSAPDYGVPGGAPKSSYIYAPMFVGGQPASGAGTSAYDLVMFSPVFSLDVCNALNTALNAPAGMIATTLNVYGPPYFTGAYSANPYSALSFPNAIGGCGLTNPTGLYGVSAWPTTDGRYTGSTYTFFFVLLAR